jgi:hypothetical protein
MRESVQKGEAHPSYQQYRTLLEVSEAIVSNRDLSALFKDMSSLLHRVVRFDHLWLNRVMAPWIHCVYTSWNLRTQAYPGRLSRFKI